MLFPGSTPGVAHTGQGSEVSRAASNLEKATPLYRVWRGSNVRRNEKMRLSKSSGGVEDFESALIRMSSRARYDNEFIDGSIV